MSFNPEERIARFTKIERAIAELHGEPLAYTAGLAARLAVMLNLIKFSVDTMRDNRDSEQVMLLMTQTLMQEIRKLLTSLHKEICNREKVDAEKSMEFSQQFEQVVRDMLNELLR